MHNRAQLFLIAGGQGCLIGFSWVVGRRGEFSWLRSGSAAYATLQTEVLQVAAVCRKCGYHLE